MNILAIDTSNEVCGVLISKNKKNYVYNKKTGFQHEEILFVEIDNLLKKSSLEIKDIDKIIVSNGPGSYTGLRIGVACALGLSVNYNIPIYYADTLHQIAYTLKNNKYDYVIPIIDAKANRVYTAIFDKNVKRLTKDEIISIDDFISIINKYRTNKKILIIGSGVTIYNNILKKEFKDKKNIIVKKTNNDVKSLLYLIDDLESSNQVNINYLQKSQAERNLNK